MSLDGADGTVRTGGSTDGGPTTRTVVVALALLAIGLAVVGSAGVAGAASGGAAAQQDGDVNVTIVFEEEPDAEKPEIDWNRESIQLSAEATEDSDYSTDEMTFDWSVPDAVGGEHESNGDQLTYSPVQADAKKTLSFEVTATAGGNEDTAVLVVEFIGPVASIEFLDDPDRNATDGGAQYNKLNFTAFETEDPNHNLSELDFDWETTDGASGELTETSEQDGEGHAPDFFAQYHVGPDDSDRTFDIVLTVTNPNGLSDTATFTINPRNDEGDETSSGDNSFSLPPIGGSDDSSPDRSPTQAGFEIASVSAPSTVEPGEDVEVTLEIENVGDEDGTATVEVGFDDAGTETVELDVPAGETSETTVTVAAPEEAGDYALGVDARDDVGSYSVSVEESTISGGGSGTENDDTDGTQSGFGLSSLLGAVFILSLVGVVARRVVS